MLTFKNLGCRRDKESLFSGVNQVIYRGQRVGVTGANGCGKSSLFGLILGELDPDEGTVEIQNGVLTGSVAQEMKTVDRSAIDYVIDGDQNLRQLEGAVDEAQHQDGERYATLLADYEAMGGYSAKSRAGSLLNGLGFQASEQQLPMSHFSGGWRMRLNLAQALMCPSDLLLLDEPTNHLDMDAIIWLENWLTQYAGTLLLISHDREFLDRTINHVLHIEQGTAWLYTGDYSAFEQARAERLSGQQAAYEKQQRRINEIQGFVDRFRAKASKARQAQSRLKMLERMTRVAPVHGDNTFGFSFQPPLKLANPLVQFDDASAGYDDTVVLKKIKTSLQAGDRVGLLGRNGAGKSTYLKSLVGEIPILAGHRHISPALNTGYFAQHQIDQLNFSRSALAHLLELDDTLGDASARDFLGGYGFRGDQALQSVGTMSGGEKARLSLALIVYQRPNLLLLDEPTNHLDMAMRQALVDALQSFEGALIVVSHDRYLLRATVDDLWLIDDGLITPFSDDLDGYAKWLMQSHRQASDDTGASRESPATDRRTAKRESALKRTQLQPLKKTANQLEKQVQKLELKLGSVREQLADNGLYSNDQKEQLADLLRQEATLKTELDTAEEQWLDALDQLEQATKEAN